MDYFYVCLNTLILYLEFIMVFREQDRTLESLDSFKLLGITEKCKKKMLKISYKIIYII